MIAYIKYKINRIMLIINSQKKLDEFNEYNQKLFNEHKYLIYTKPRLGYQRGLPQNALLHKWVTQIAAHFTGQKESDITTELKDGTKQLMKKECWADTKQPFLIAKRYNFKTKETVKYFSSSAKWRADEMTFFLNWIQSEMGIRGLVLESTGDFEYRQKNLDNNF